MTGAVEFVSACIDDDERAAISAMEFNGGHWELIASATVNLGPREPERAVAGRAVDPLLANVLTAGEREAERARTWDGIVNTDNDPGVARHMVRHDPISVLLGVTAKRKMLALHRGAHECSGYNEWGERDNRRWYGESENCPTVLLLAAGFADRPGYAPAWSAT